MYTHNEIGPWPIIDPSVSKIEVTTGFAATERSAPLKVRLDTANLGTKKEAFTNVFHNEDIALTFLTERISYGVALAPAETIGPGPKYVQFDLSVSIHDNSASRTPDIVCTPFIGYIDAVGAAIGDGWAAANLVTDWVGLPAKNISDDHTSMSTQILLKDIISGGLDDDKFLVCGFVLSSMDGQTLLGLDYMISARYASKQINTIGRG